MVVVLPFLKRQCWIERSSYLIDKGFLDVSLFRNHSLCLGRIVGSEGNEFNHGEVFSNLFLGTLRY